MVNTEKYRPPKIPNRCIENSTVFASPEKEIRRDRSEEEVFAVCVEMLISPYFFESAHGLPGSDEWGIYVVTVSDAV